MQAKVEIEVVDFILGKITKDPNSFTVESSIDEKGIIVDAYVDETQLGRVIGKKGDTAETIRKLLRVIGMQHDMRISFKIHKREANTAQA